MEKYMKYSNYLDRLFSYLFYSHFISSILKNMQLYKYPRNVDIKVLSR